MNKIKLTVMLLVAAALLTAVVVQADSNKKARPVKTRPKVVSQVRPTPANTLKASAVEHKGTKVRRHLFCSGTVLRGSSSKFHLGPAPNDKLSGTVGQVGVGSGSSESFGTSGGYWQPPGEEDLRGDANGDGLIDLADVIWILNYLFRGGAPPVSLKAGDADCNGSVDLGDAIYLLNYLFRGGPPPSC
jgi:hypothetical protein